MTAAKPVIITSVPQKYPFFEASECFSPPTRTFELVTTSAVATSLIFNENQAGDLLGAVTSLRRNRPNRER
jgi:hypothetical protein